jgi:hypothetical protein
MNSANDPIYLKKSAKFYKIYGGLFLFSIIMSVVVRPLMKNYPYFLDLLVGLPIFAMFIMAPIGLFYSWKSYTGKRGCQKPGSNTLLDIYSFAY